MRRLGRVLASMGLALGIITGLSLVIPAQSLGLPFIVGLALVKLAFASSLALIAAGAVMQRAALRRAEPPRELPR
jgi:hypothetical protein